MNNTNVNNVQFDSDLQFAMEFKLLELYPREWQVCFNRTLHPWVLQMALWHYWLWFTFIVGMTFYIIYFFKNVSFNRADIRGKSATGERRRLAWSELLVCLIPLFWSINIISNAFMYLRVLEHSGGYVFLSVQIFAYQWGWKYYYGDTIYGKSYGYPYRVGLNSLYTITPIDYRVQELKFLNLKEEFAARNIPLRELDMNLLLKMQDKSFNFGFVTNFKYLKNSSLFELLKVIITEMYTYDISTLDDYKSLKGEIYYCRFILKQLGVLNDSYNELVKNQRFYPGYLITSQGVNPNNNVLVKIKNSINLTYDYNRLFRTTGSIVLPSRIAVRLMASSEDITHSWAVPGLGIKIDCVPGKLFCILTNILRDGIYFGQCSELCGWNHYNMPISVYALSLNHFILWWELELHSVFNEEFSSDKVRGLRLDDSLGYYNYFLLNWKFK